MRCLIVGSGRCGSTLLQKMLDEHPDLFVFPETHWIPMLLERWGGDPAPVREMKSIVESTYHVGGEPTLALEGFHLDALNSIGPTSTVREFVDTIGSASAGNAGKRFFADKTPDYGPWLAELQKTWPEVVVIHLLRDGVAVGESMSAHPGFQVLAGTGETHWPQLALDWEPDQAKAALEAAPKLRDFVQLWRRRVEQIRECADALSPGSYLEVRYEELLSNPRSILQRIVEHIDIDPVEDWINSASQMIDRSRGSTTQGATPIPKGLSGEDLRWVRVVREELEEQLYNDGLRVDRRKPTNAVAAFACVRNEMLRLPWFLKHYRSIGVDQFHFVDNGSEDGTFEFLRSQDDVAVHRTTESYRESNYGTQWINELLDEHAQDQWVLVVDADELLVYPYCEYLPIDGLTKHLDDHGSNAMVTPMLDMYGFGPVRGNKYRSGESLPEAFPFFDGDMVESIGPEHIEDPGSGRGGVRDRLFWSEGKWDHNSPYLKKLALLRWQPEFTLTDSTHRIDGAVEAPTTGILLHFKFLPDFAVRAEEEVTRGEHFGGARQYVAYREGFDASPDLTAWYPGSIRYRDSVGLIERGLLRVSPDLPIPSGGRPPRSWLSRQLSEAKR